MSTTHFSVAGQDRCVNDHWEGLTVSITSNCIPNSFILDRIHGGVNSMCAPMPNTRISESMSTHRQQVTKLTRSWHHSHQYRPMSLVPSIPLLRVHWARAGDEASIWNIQQEHFSFQKHDRPTKDKPVCEFDSSH